MQEEVVKSHRDWIQELYVKEFIKPKLHPNDFYWDEGVMVMTEHYHLRRGTCCGSGCRHCPYEKHNRTKQTASPSKKGNS